MADEGTEQAIPSSFSFRWGGVSVELSGAADLVREGITLVRDEIIPKLSSEAPSNPPPPSPASPQAAPAASPPIQQSAADAGEPTVSAEDFFKSKQPKTEQEKAVVLACWAKTYQGLTEFTVEQMEKLHNQAHAPFKNVKNAIYNAGRKDFGWISVVPGKRNIYYLTPAGENYVKTKLPKQKSTN
jgi:hypothetical protein